MPRWGIGEMKSAYRILVGEPEGKILLGRLGINGRMMLKWIFKKYGVIGCGLDLSNS
jgi:hypothetical protein